jgi:hypothetical protein
MADRQLPALAQAMGAEGLREHYPFARHLMGARVAGFVDGSTEMLLERICAVTRLKARCPCLRARRIPSRSRCRCRSDRARPFFAITRNSPSTALPVT